MHVAVSRFHAIVQAIPQVQLVESVKVHNVETVNVVTQDRDSKSLNRMWMRGVGLRGTLEVAASPEH